MEEHRQLDRVPHGPTVFRCGGTRNNTNQQTKHKRARWQWTTHDRSPEIERLEQLPAGAEGERYEAPSNIRFARVVAAAVVVRKLRVPIEQIDHAQRGERVGQQWIAGSEQ